MSKNTFMYDQNNVAEEERQAFEKLMDKIGWFMFDLLVLDYVQDHLSGVSFSTPIATAWKIYIEVCSVTVISKWLPKLN